MMDMHLLTVIFFSECSGIIYEIEDIDMPQSIQVFYRKDPTKKKMYDVLSRIKDIMIIPGD